MAKKPSLRPVAGAVRTTGCVVAMPTVSRVTPAHGENRDAPVQRRTDMLPLGAMLFGALLPALSSTPASAQTAAQPPGQTTTQSTPSVTAQAKDAPEVTLPTVEVKDARV